MWCNAATEVIMLNEAGARGQVRKSPQMKSIAPPGSWRRARSMLGAS
jgi:hypothetical protein